MPAADETLNVEARLIDQVSPAMQKMTSKAKAGFDKMSRNAAKFSGGMDKAFSKVVNLKNAIAGFVALKGFQVLVGRVAKLGDSFDKMSHRLQVSTDFLQELDHVAKLAGSDVRTMETGIRKLAKSALDADRGLETYARSFRELRVDVRGSSGQMKEVDQIFWEVTEALADVEDPLKKVALAQELLGRSGTALLPVVDAGSEAIREQREEAHRLGGVLDKEAIKATVDYTDAMHRLNVVIRALQVKFIIPFIRKMADRIQEFVDRGGLERMETAVRALTAAGKTLFLMYSASKIMALVGGLKLVGTEAEMMAAKAARAQAILNGLKFAGIFAILTALQLAFNKVLDRMEEVNKIRDEFEERAKDPAILEQLIKSREQWDANAVRIAEINKGYEKMKTLTISQRNAMKLGDKELQNLLKTQRNLNLEAENLVGWTHAQGTGIFRNVEAMQKELEAVKRRRAEAEKVAKKKEPDDTGVPTEDELKAARDRKQKHDEELFNMMADNAQKTTEFLEGEDQRRRDYEIEKFHREQAQWKIRLQRQLGIEKEAADKREKEEEKARLTREQGLKAQEQGTKQLTDTLISEGSRGVQAFIKNEKRAKRISLMASIAEGALAVTRALKNPPGPPFSIPQAIATGVIAAANTATIAAQSFQGGGFPQGQNALIKVNEAGQEAILNAGAVSRTGHGTINAMNAGAVNPGNINVTNEISYSPTYNLEGDRTEDVVSKLEEDKGRFASFVEDMRERGYFNSKGSGNLVKVA